MTLTCRAVDVERVDCPRCKKTLTIRVLAYKHHRYCRAYTDRVSERTAQAQRIYDRNMRRALGDSEKRESIGDNVDDNMSDSEAMSENSTAATSESTRGPQNSAIYSSRRPRQRPRQTLARKQRMRHLRQHQNYNSARKQPR